MNIAKIAAAGLLFIFAGSAFAVEQAPIFRAVDVNGQTFSLATTTVEEGGRSVTCSQYVKDVRIEEAGSFTQVTIGNDCDS